MVIKQVVGGRRLGNHTPHQILPAFSFLGVKPIVASRKVPPRLIQALNNLQGQGHGTTQKAFVVMPLNFI